ncbi:MAG: aminotransferase class I/II-fold pyridoxal phosphate-dependent enzyme [Planctomycetes bacterium]|nr:aminotransferase class I/II-fold pyridoxal phosphate-dependent enzyme [Planctomycetota bacterium]NUQ33845.1 aminotransferase class I/II-fold pyridoxal phosphate-dependent enzyme [Planctomycetaceae bacterium]
MHDISDFRSDAVTRPTKAMYDAMMNAPLGDDIFGDDPTVKKLEKLAATKLGKEASLFVPSGVMANQIAIKMHTRPGDELICDDLAHVFNFETGATAALAGVQVRTVPSKRGMPALADVLRAVQSPVDYHPRTGLLVLENTHNFHGGSVLPQADVVEMCRVVHDVGLPCHLDGARLANASVASGTSMAELAAPFDSVTLTLSKGLGSPVGSMLAGSRAFIDEARRLRKMRGGGMRQVGILAACGIVSLETMIARLADDHANCKRLAEGLGNIKGVEVVLPVETNILFFRIPGKEQRFEAIGKELTKRGVLAIAGGGKWRMVTHYDVDKDDIDKAIKVWAEVLKQA